MSSSASPASNEEAQHKRPSTVLVLSLLTLIIAILVALFLPDSDPAANLFRLKRLFAPAASAGRSSSSLSTTTTTTSPASTTPATNGKMGRTPVYFLSHGGPNVMYDQEHPAYAKLAAIGREITTKVKPRAVVVFSAHWQAGRDTIQVNTAEKTDLIYDFYGFPSHYYKETFPHVGSQEVAGKVLGLLNQAGIKAEGVKRGLDHGVWASFKCAFEPESNPLNVPIVQVSLFGSEDPEQHYRLGEAVSSLRDDNILIIVSGMAVHNLRDLMRAFGNPKPMPYTISFDEALKDAATKPPAEREQAMVQLLKRGDARQAHPSFEHLLPIHIGAGAAGEDLGRRLWTYKDGSMSWAQYRFGDVAGGSSSL
ncbi:aromatic ring-opening dioxygenase LigB subunit [Aspergillus taichungensis]|uniref:Aromatic ring-opening dioxygenase LigB subunit n=1 Tax=Aspergillus taichungensis TaxID=482145 RepID=A0A2J5I7Y6_9EURO|nr:aromatic ring-opening dioxygenase LigB subunit [Aspergillus taichungensis]